MANPLWLINYIYNYDNWVDEHINAQDKSKNLRIYRC